MASFKPLILALTTLATCSLATAQEFADRSKLYQWLDANGFAYVAKNRFIEYAVDWHSPRDPSPPRYSQYGFLIDSSTNGFSVADPAQSTGKFPSEEDGHKATAAYRDGDYHLWAVKQCDQYEKDSAYLSYGGLGALRAISLARACAARNLPSLERRFYDLATGVRDFALRDSSNGLLGVLINENMKWREELVNSHLSDPDFRHETVLDEVKKWLTDYPDAVNAYMKDTKTVLEAMVEEEATHGTPAPPESNTNVRQLIFDLRDVHRYQTSNPGDVYFAGNPHLHDEVADDAPGRLVNIGLSAVPQLIEALKDRAFTRSSRIARVAFAEIPRVQDAAFQIIGAIAHKDFDHDEDHEMHMTIPSTPDPDRSLTGMNNMRDLFAGRTKRVEAWWAEVRRDGEAAVLAKAIETGDPSFRGAAQRLATIDPSNAIKAITEGLKHEQRDVGTSDLVQSLAKLDWQTAAPTVRQQMTSGKNISTRMVAAEIEAKHDPEAAVQAMNGELRAYIGVRRPNYDGFADSIDGVLWFLAESHRTSALPLFKQAMESSESLRYDVTSALCPYPSLSKNKESVSLTASLSPVERAAFEAQVEDLLAGELQRTEKGHGHTYRMCDEACDSLARNWPDKYKMDFGATLGQRDAYCLAALNKWRADRNLAPAKALHVALIEPLSEDQMKPLIDAVCSAATSAEKEKAEAAIMAKGLPALPAVMRAQDRNPGLKNLTFSLSCLVREIIVKGTPPPCGKRFLADVLKLKGTSIAADIITDLVTRDGENWTANAAGLSITGDRDAYGEGFVLHVSFPGIDLANGSGGWAFTSDANGKGFGGGGRDFNIGSIDAAFHVEPMVQTHFSISIWHKP